MLTRARPKQASGGFFIESSWLAFSSSPNQNQARPRAKALLFEPKAKSQELRASFLTALANVFVQHALPLALSFQDELYGISQGTFATAVGRDVVGFRFHFGTGIFHGDGQASDAHGGQIDHVVADEGCFLGLEAFLLEDILEARLLVLNALMYVLQLQFASAQ